MSLLDEIILLPPPLEIIDPIAPSADLCFSAKTDFTHNQPPSTSSIRLVPWALGNSTPAIVGERWVDLCCYAKLRNCLLDCSAEHLQNVPLNSIPRRIFRQFIEQPFSADEFSSADVIEIVLFSQLREIWGLPPELVEAALLPDLLDAVRTASGGNSTIAVSVKVGLEAAMIESIIAARPDILSLDATDTTRDELTVATLAQVRNFPLKSPAYGQSILLRTRHSQPDSLVKLLALGASVVTIDSVLGEVWSENSQVPNGFLSKVQSSIDNMAECPIERALQSLDKALEKALDLTSDSPMVNLGGRLRATTERAARIAMIPLLE